MIQAFLKHDQLLSSIRRADAQDPNFTLWWLGQSGFLIHWQGQYLLFDPYLSDSLTVKYADTEKPHIRMTELAIDPARLDGIHVVTSTHNHTDHLDAFTLNPLMQANPDLKLIIPEANRAFVAERLGCAVDFPIGLNDGQHTTVGHFTLHGLPAAHNELDRDQAGRCRYMGYVARFGPWAVYHSGDTLWYPGLEDYLTPFEIDLALLPINGNKPERKVAGNLNGKEAAQLGRAIGARMVIPCHYDMFTFNTADPAEFAHYAKSEQQPYCILQCGEPWSSERMG